jgi:hypothetical protein
MAQSRSKGGSAANRISCMAAGREMDALIAREVMGYRIGCEEDQGSAGEDTRTWYIMTGQDGLDRSPVPGYSTDIQAAWRVAKEMKARGDELSLECRRVIDDDPGADIWTALFRQADRFAMAGTPALAICRAALLTVPRLEPPSVRPVETTEPLSVETTEPLSAKPVETTDLVSVIEHELKRVMGPVATVIVDDTLVESGKSRGCFPEDVIEPFVRALGEEITDVSKREQFMQAALLAVAKRKSPPRKHAEGDLVSVTEHELKRVMGPVATVIVDEKLAELGESRDCFPEDRIESFVLALREEITDLSKRARFSRAMAEYLTEK